jgi:prolipoprotein diacylglyceryltransferase
LWHIYNKRGLQFKKGFLFGLFLVLVFSVRFLIEFFKENQEVFENSLPINMGQILSVPFVIVGLYFILPRSFIFKENLQLKLKNGKPAK